MDIECSETYEYNVEMDDKIVLSENIPKTEKLYVYQNDLKYIKYNEIDISKVKDFPKNYDFSTIDARINECIKNNYEYFDLSHLNLDMLPDTLKNDVKLFTVKHLFISDNNFKIININIFNNLVTVDLSNNKLKSIPTLPKTIEELSITHNSIETEDLHKYKHLKRLDISNNKLSSLSIIKAVEVLRCDDNNITHIKSYPKLKKISCERNNIHTIEQSEYLEILECNENNITKILNFPNLRELYCNNNDIVNVGDIPLINILHCVKNKISKIYFFPILKELACDYSSTLDISKKYNIKDSHIYENYAVLFF
jgi:Leucine-rich repeat (LRR) protein